MPKHKQTPEERLETLEERVSALETRADGISYAESQILKHARQLARLRAAGLIERDCGSFVYVGKQEIPSYDQTLTMLLNGAISDLARALLKD